MAGVESPLNLGQIDVALSNFAMKYRNLEFAADQVASRLLVDIQSGKYYIWGDENLDASKDDTRAPGAAAERYVISRSTDAYACEDHSREALIPDEQRGIPGVDIEQVKTGLLMDLIFLRREKIFADMVTDTAQVTQNVTKTTTAQWNDANTVGNPIKDVQLGQDTIVKNAGVKPNVLVLGQEVFSHLRVNAKIVERVQNVRLGAVTVEDLMSIFDVDRIVVARAISRAAGTSSFLFGKNVLLAYVEDSPTVESKAFMKSFVWSNAPGTVGGFQVEKGRATPVSRKADEIAAHWYYDEKITSVRSAYLIKDAIA